MAWKKFWRKNYKNNLRSNNYVVCTAVALCLSNILDVKVIHNVNLSEDKIGRPPLWSNDTDVDICHQSVIYAVSSTHFNRTSISYIYICNGFLLHNTVTSKCIYHRIDTFATSQYRSTWWQRVKFQHFVAFFTFVLKLGMTIDHKRKYK
jgi:hypothetical protein